MLLTTRTNNQNQLTRQRLKLKRTKKQWPLLIKMLANRKDNKDKLKEGHQESCEMQLEICKMEVRIQTISRNLAKETQETTK